MASRHGGITNRAKITALVLKDIDNMAGSLRKVGVALNLGEFLYGTNQTLKQSVMVNSEEILVNPLVDKSTWPRNVDNNFSWMHEYPSPEFVPHYIGAMHDTLKQIKNCTNCDRLKLASLISDYYYTGINAHIFERVNQSLLMGQVNYLLLKFGFHGLSHRSETALPITFDGAALIMGAEKFKKFFLDNLDELAP